MLPRSTTQPQYSALSSADITVYWHGGSVISYQKVAAIYWSNQTIYNGGPAPGTYGAGSADYAFVAVGRMNQALFDSLPQSRRDTAFSHPEYGSISVDWVIYQMAGHQIHHLRQLEQIAA